MATIGTDEIMGMLGNATIGAPTNIDYSQYSSESIDDLINAVAGGGGIFQNILGGIGLKNIQDRVEEIKGSFSIKSEPNQGTDLYIQTPIYD